MKHLMLMAFFCLLAVSCSNENEDKVMNQQALVPVTVSVNDFSITQGEFPDAPGGARSTTRAQAVGSYNGIKAVTLAFYSGSSEVYKTTQLKSDESTYTTFGNFSLSLPVGSYTLVVLGYGLYDDDEFILTSPTQAGFTGDVRETFAATQNVSITDNSAVNLSVTLNRVITKLKVVSTDGKAANVAKVRMTFAAGNKSFNPQSGLATVNTGSASTVSNSSPVGETSSSVGYVFLATDEQTMDVTIETLDAGGNTIYSTVVNDVPFKRNRCTTLSGSLYPTAGVASSFQVNTSWLDEEDPINF